MVLIYVATSPPRLQYIASFIFKEIIKTPYSITSHAESFKSFDGIKIDYTNGQSISGALKIPNCGLLYETGIREQAIEIFEVDGIRSFFKSPDFKPGSVKDEYPFDIFSAAFYLISRYEEYLPHQEDNLGRYDHKISLAYRNDFLQLPLVNIWIEQLLEWLQQKYPELVSHPAAYKFIPTYDIDIAYSFLDKGMKKNIAGGLQSLVQLRLTGIADRIRVLNGKQKDPFDHFSRLEHLHTKYSLQPVYFFLVAEKNGRYDKNILPGTKTMKALVSHHAKQYSIGLHPSWQSSIDHSLIHREKNILETMAGSEINQSRQHYIRFTLPQGYRQLLAEGLENDYSMGYPAINGFRASVTSTHFWYDLEEEKQTKLKIHPFCFMDSTAIFDEKITPARAFLEMLYYNNICKSVHGTLITIVHNHFLGSHHKEWRDIYEKFLEKISAG
ncbi:MAG: hypothetical protein ABJA57_01330 [Ginsengibacter sp.]